MPAKLLEAQRFGAALRRAKRTDGAGDDLPNRPSPCRGDPPGRFERPRHCNRVALDRGVRSTGA
jgi:hypothetical protein